MVSVLILTHNEEQNLSECLSSVVWSDDVVVFDSFSDDDTVRIARAAGARICQRRFDDYASQRSAALTEVSYRHPWVLMIDADERVPAALAAEIRAVVAMAGPDVAMFRFRRNDYFFGSLIRRSAGYPTWFGRLMRVGRVTISRPINEEYHTDGVALYLKEHLDHLPFNRGIAYWIDRHNRYSGMEAQSLITERAKPIRLRDLLTKDAVDRRRALKRLAYRMPMRPLLVFLYLYVVRRGMLDGAAGYRFCVLRAMYEKMIDLKVMELQRRQAGLSV
jgi:glycosyltransferase involved in cell wall biosynthesis